jgi:hypothetical protein
MNKPKVGDEIRYGINRFKVASIKYDDMKQDDIFHFTNGLSETWENLYDLLYFGKVAVFRGEETVNLK